MATRIIEGADAPTNPRDEGISSKYTRADYVYEPSRFEDQTRDDHRLRRMIDRSAIISRGASVLVDILAQNAASAESPDVFTPYFRPCHRGAIADLVREALEMLAEEAAYFAAERPAQGAEQ